MVIISAFQADDAGSIPVIRSNEIILPTGQDNFI